MKSYILILYLQSTPEFFRINLEAPCIQINSPKFIRLSSYLYLQPPVQLFNV